MYGGEANTHFTTGPWSVRSKLNKSECVQWARLCTDRGWGHWAGALYSSEDNSAQSYV